MTDQHIATLIFTPALYLYGCKMYNCFKIVFSTSFGKIDEEQVKSLKKKAYNFNDMAWIYILLVQIGSIIFKPWQNESGFQVYAHAILLTVALWLFGRLIVYTTTR